MSIPDEIEQLISTLSAPLASNVRAAFRQAAEEALARVPCLGEGAVYRAIAPLQRAFFDPPDFHRAAWDISQERGVTTKLLARPALAYGGDQRHVRYRQPKAAG